MIARDTTLADVCFFVGKALDAYGIRAVLTGGSAATVYVPEAYSSLDADFVLEHDVPLTAIAKALHSIGFTRDGKSRIFVHADTSYTVDFPRGPLAVGGDYVHETAILTKGDMALHILTPTDCVRDRLAHFYHWDDYTALKASVAVAAANRVDLKMDILRSWSIREENIEKFNEFERRLNKVKK